jgi:hypothetical protein
MVLSAAAAAAANQFINVLIEQQTDSWPVETAEAQRSPLSVLGCTAELPYMQLLSSTYPATPTWQGNILQQFLSKQLVHWLQDCWSHEPSLGPNLLQSPVY